MKTHNDVVTSYINSAAPFAIPILTQLREDIHQFCPEVREVIKWNFPCFEFKGGILCFFAAHKTHCSFGFWLENELVDVHGLLAQKKMGGMGSIGKISQIDQLPASSLLEDYILQGMKLIEAGATLKKKPNRIVVVPKIPPELEKAFEKDAVAKSVFDNFPPSQRKEYIVWLTDAKTEATFHKRLVLTLSNLHEGKTKDWKYQK